MTKLSHKALRHYEKKGLLEPAITDPINNYRYYHIDQLEEGIKIKMLVNMGFGLDEVKSILDAAAREEHDLLEAMFRKKHAEVKLEIARLQRIEEIMRTNAPMELLYMQCSEPQIKHVPEMRVICQRESGIYSQTISKLITNLMTEIHHPDNRKNLVKITGPIMFICHDEEYKETDADIEVAIPISGRVSISDESTGIRYLEETEVLSLIYTGPYEDLGIGYTKLLEQANKHGFTTGHETREIYLNDLSQVAPDELMTEIQVPIRRDDDGKN